MISYHAVDAKTDQSVQKIQFISCAKAPVGLRPKAPEEDDGTKENVTERRHSQNSLYLYVKTIIVKQCKTMIMKIITKGRWPMMIHLHRSY